MKGGALPTEDFERENDDDYTVVVGAKVAAVISTHPGTDYPHEYSFPEQLVPQIVSFEVHVDGEPPFDVKVDGKAWSIVMHTA